MVQVGPRRGRPLRDVRAHVVVSHLLVSPGAVRRRSQLPVPRAKARGVLHTPHLAGNIIPTRCNSLCEKFASQVKAAAPYHNVHWVRRAPRATPRTCHLEPGFRDQSTLPVHNLVHHGHVSLVSSLHQCCQSQLFQPLLIGASAKACDHLYGLLLDFLQTVYVLPVPG